MAIHPAFAQSSAMASAIPPLAAWDMHASWVLLGLFMIALELMLPTKGILGFLGALFFLVGTVSLADSPQPFFHLSWPAIIAMNILVMGTLGIVVLLTLRGYTRNPVKTTHPFIGQTAKIIEWTTESKRIDYGGAIWQAASDQPFKPGDRVIIRDQDNLVIHVTSPER